MGRRRVITALTVLVVASALLAGQFTAAEAATTGSASAAAKNAAGSSFFGSLTPAQAAALSKNVDRPVIVVLKSQFARSSVQSPLVAELRQVHATNVKRFQLVDAVSATVSAAAESLIAASPAVDEVIPDVTFSGGNQKIPASPRSGLRVPAVRASRFCVQPGTAGRYAITC